MPLTGANESGAAPRTSEEVQSRMREALQAVFGFQRFRPNQEEIVAHLLRGRDVFAVMPTGSGKSLCYQLPARLARGPAVVVSPLIALMKDQVDAARENGLGAAFVNSSISPDEMGRVMHRLRRGEIELLYIAPERFAVQGFLRTLRSLPIAFFAIDEAHCISEWGHDFRPDYLNLSALRGLFPGVPISAFTATATPAVQRDIVQRLSLNDPFVVRASFNRPNLFYEARPREGRGEAQILAFVRGNEGKTGIVYRTTRALVDEAARALRDAGVRAAPYHAGMDAQDRRRNQDLFKNDEIDVIVATIAFGMGIDKPNIRYVLHADLPKNVEGYYQETGRAGRDGEPAHCLLLYGRGDAPRLRFMLNQIEDPAARAVALDNLERIAAYAAASRCRRAWLLNHFGEAYDRPNCETCDVCSGGGEMDDATSDARLVLSAAAQTGQRYGAAYLADVVSGARTQRIRESGHDALDVYGAGGGRKKTYWRSLIDDLLAQGFLEQAGVEYPTIHLTPKGEKLFLGGETFQTVREKRREPPPAAQASKAKDDGGGYDESLFRELKKLRRAIALERNEPPYLIFHDRALKEMCRALPKNDLELLAVEGVGETKLERYGRRFLEAIKDRGAESNGKR